MIMWYKPYVNGQVNVMIEILYAFLLGIFSILSPCSFIIVPVIAVQAGRRLQHLIQFLLGLVIVFSLLGALVAVIGKLLTNFIGAYLYIIAGVITLVSGLELLHVMRIPFPNIFSLRKSKQPFILGILFGGVALGCIGPLLGAILAFVLAKGQVITGAMLMFVYALGFILPLILFGYLITDKKIIKKVSTHFTAIRITGGIVLLLVSLYLLILGFRGIL